MAMQKKEKILGGAAGAAGVAGGGALGPGVAPVTLGLFLLPGGRPGRCFTGAADDDPAADGIVLLLLPQGRPRPRGATEEPRIKWEPSASTMWKSVMARNPRWREKMMRKRRNLIRVFTLTKDALFISTYYRAPVISKAHKCILQRSSNSARKQTISSKGEK
jgi:hypothetical protein